jgi:hypothetical protein
MHNTEVDIDIYQGYFLSYVIADFPSHWYVAFMKMKSEKTCTIGNVHKFSGFRINGANTLLRPAFLLLLMVTTFAGNVRAQDPVLPGTNLGLANVYDGFAGKPGFYFQGYAQAFHTSAFYDQAGNKSPSDLKINSILMMNQFLYLTPKKVLGGYLAFTVLVPFVQITSSSISSPAPSVNPGIIGDPIVGTAVQWSNRKLFGKQFAHRLEFDVSIPAGNYDSRYNINPSAHLWNYEAYYTFTVMLNKKISVSSRVQLNYNEHVIGTQDKPGAFYNGNYSIDYSFLPSFKIEAVAYSLQQFNQDTHGGDSHYYQDQFGIYNTKERVLGYGPGIVYFAPNGVLVEAKMFFETAVQNRLAGTRPTVRLVIPLTK